MIIKLYIHPKCSTCKKAIESLNDQNMSIINILEHQPSKEELSNLLNEKKISSVFNTSGMQYREMNLKENIHDLSKEEAINLLSNNPMLIKRPVYIDPDTHMYVSGYDKSFYEKEAS